MSRNSSKSSGIELMSYEKVEERSQHGLLFTINEDDSDEEEVNQTPTTTDEEAPTIHRESPGANCTPCTIWDTLTFGWMKKLLTVGNQKPLDLEDLYALPKSDTAKSVYQRFKQSWNHQLLHEGGEDGSKASLTLALIEAFGKPFILAGCLKLIHDSTIFLGPLLLNSLIKFLRDDSQPMIVGIYYVIGLFFVNLTMSLCLRQYFW